MSMRTRASEFPNDNVALHRGAIWVSAAPGALLEPEWAHSPVPPPVILAPEPVESPPEPEICEDIEVVDELPPIEVFDVTAIDAVATAPVDDPLVAIVVQVAEQAGIAGAKLVVPAVFGPDDVHDWPEAIAASVVHAGIGVEEPGGVRIAPHVRAAAAVWHAVLQGDDADLSACSPPTLDEWCADLVAKMAGARQKTEVFRRELRSLGVAAYGLV